MHKSIGLGSLVIWPLFGLLQELNEKEVPLLKPKLVYEFHTATHLKNVHCLPTFLERADCELFVAKVETLQPSGIIEQFFTFDTKDDVHKLVSNMAEIHNIWMISWYCIQHYHTEA